MILAISCELYCIFSLVAMSAKIHIFILTVFYIQHPVFDHLCLSI